MFPKKTLCALLLQLPLLLLLLLTTSSICFAQHTAEQQQVNQLLNEAQKNTVRDTLKSRQALQQALQIANRHKLNRSIGKVYSISAELAGRAGRHKESLMYTNKAMDIYKKISDTAGIASMHINLGNTYENLGNIKEAETNQLQAIKLFQQLKNETMVGMGLMNLGITYFRAGNQTKGVDYALQSLKIREKLGKEEDLAYSYATIGTMYLYTNKFDESITYNKKSLQLSEKSGNLDRISASKLNIAKALSAKGNYAEAKKYVLQVVAPMEKLGDKRGLRHCYEQLSAIAEKEKNIDEAVAWQNKALDIYKNVDDNFAEYAPLMNRVRLYTLQKKYGEAEKDVAAAEKIALKQNLFQEMEHIKRTQVNLYTLLGRADEAKAAFEQFEKYKDSTLNATSLKQINELKTKYETEKKQNQIDFLTSQNTIQSLNLKNKTLALNASQLESERNELEIQNKNLDLQQKNITIQQKELKAKNDAQQISLLNEQTTVQRLQLKTRSQTIAIVSGLLLIALILAVSGFILFHNFRAKAKLKQEQLVLENKLLEEQANTKIQEQRLEISRELHDSLGSQLTFISAVLDSLKSPVVKLDETLNSKISTLSDFSENSINELKNTIWALNSKELKLNDLKLKLLNFIRNASEAKEDVKFNFDFEAPNNFQLSSKQAINLFRAFQEIINNALKYAKAKNISAFVKQTKNVLQIGITDDGIGFDLQQAEQKSYGISNIKNRIAELNGKLVIETAPNKGTRYEIEISLI